MNVYTKEVNLDTWVNVCKKEYRQECYQLARLVNQIELGSSWNDRIHSNA